ncbi:BTB/POZ and MATH domain-containing protein 1-like [Oryza brachyantha]|uniref:BTB domain-containing protein n=1 Tax=Oryza brachyantha TaxID=4533 RepID=J3MCY8_ORYBR|nr:BTB/POZ and MATH domain-containing protein 1-like [Oryza brachyantha]XP_015693906.1 BTB/POZ and MATH domain-containing protein 1-like [Oryza brachyantha]
MEPPTNITDTTSAVHLLKINGYSVTKALSCSEYISSRRLAAGGFDWEVLYYPRYYEHGVYWVALRLMFMSKKCKHEVKAALKCQLVDEAQMYLPSSGSKSVSSKYTGQRDCGPALLLVKQDDLPESIYFRGDSFVVECTITVLREPQEAVANTASPSVANPCCHLHLQLGELLLSEKGADVTFAVAGESFLAHKIILAARSPVFMAEFFGPMRESSSRCVEIKDMEAPVFRAMLRFIYTGTSPELDQQQDITTTMAQHLLVAADRYGLDRLKLICQERLHSDINVDTAAATLAFAEQHSCSQLKDRCVEFVISSRANLDAVMATEGYRLVIASCPSVLDTLLRAAVGR